MKNKLENICCHDGLKDCLVVDPYIRVLQQASWSNTMAYIINYTYEKSIIWPETLGSFTVKLLCLALMVIHDNLPLQINVQ